MTKEWKQHLYDNYLSSGQGGADKSQILNSKNFPYYLNIIKNFLPKNKEISILDLACGHGSLIFCLKESGYKKITGIDISSEQVLLAQNYGIKEVQYFDMMDFLDQTKNTYDVIFLMDIIEHLSKSELFVFLEKINKVLTPNGMVIIHIPNAEGLFGMRIRYGDITHEICFTPQAIKQSLAVSGFNSIKCYEDKPVIHGLKSFFRHLVWNILSAPFRILLAAETGNNKHILSQCMLVIARKLSN